MYLLVGGSKRNYKGSQRPSDKYHNEWRWNISPSSWQRRAQTSEVSQVDQQPRSERVIQNFRSLFSPYPARSVPGPSLSARNNSYRPPPPKQLKKTIFFQVKETWTHDFFCLASKTATIVPPRGEKISLQNAGLGRRKVVFPCRASAVDILPVAIQCHSLGMQLDLARLWLTSGHCKKTCQ